MAAQEISRRLLPKASEQLEQPQRRSKVMAIVAVFPITVSLAPWSAAAGCAAVHPAPFFPVNNWRAAPRSTTCAGSAAWRVAQSRWLTARPLHGVDRHFAVSPSLVLGRDTTLPTMA